MRLAGAPGLASVPGSCPARTSACGMPGRRWPAQGGGRRRKARPGRTRRLPGRSRVAGVWQRDAGRQEERRPLPWPAGDSGPPAPSAGTGGATTAGRTPQGSRPIGTRGGSPKRRESRRPPPARRGRCPRAAGRGDTVGAGGPSEPPDRGGSGQGACLGLVSGRGAQAGRPNVVTVSPSATHWCGDRARRTQGCPRLRPCM